MVYLIMSQFCKGGGLTPGLPDGGWTPLDAHPEDREARGVRSTGPGSTEGMGTGPG